MKYFNRDQSWVEFNARILNEGMRKDNPLMERIKFLGIVSTNFDEFFEVRIASMKRAIADGTAEEGTEKILSKISERCHGLIGHLYDELRRDVMEELPKFGVRYISVNDFSEQQRAFAGTFFQNEIFPLLTPLRSEGRFPHFPGNEVFIAFKVSMIDGVKNQSAWLDGAEKSPRVSFVQIPRSLERIIWLPSDGDEKHFTMIDDIILEFGTSLFPGFSVESAMLFSIDRDADMGVDEESSQFIEAMEDVIASRHNSFAVRLICSKCSEEDEELICTLAENLGLSDEDVYRIKGPLHPEDFSVVEETAARNALVGIPAVFEPWKTFSPMKKSNKSVWELVESGDRLIFLPYESFDPVTKLIESAADDPKVLAIKMTLYRTERNSAIVKSLIRAARNGKQVTVFVELKARFDEERNISWASQLEKSGAIVIYGIVNLKVHGKAMMIIRRESDGIRRYVHLSTGNYNAKTAKIYSDLALLSTNPEIANDITLFFNLISGYSALQTMKQIAVAPINLKSRLLSMIKREAESSTPENPGMIVAKMNALGHEEIIDALYEASRKGVRILLNIRGICQLVPGIPGQSENITVVSIVGRYLEHARAVYFKNSGNEEIYLSSADWMPRNLDRRVELLFPILDKKCFSEIKDDLMMYFDDDTHSSILQSDGTWLPAPAGGKFSVQKQLHEKYRMQNEIAKKKAVEFKIRRK